MTILGFHDTDVEIAIKTYEEGELCAGATFLRKDGADISEEERLALVKSHAQTLVLAQCVVREPAKASGVSMKWSSTSKKNRKVGPNLWTTGSPY
jgi:hypothetical protein